MKSHPAPISYSWTPRDGHVGPETFLSAVLTKKNEYRADNPELRTGFRD